MAPIIFVVLLQGTRLFKASTKSPMTEDLYKDYILSSEADSEPVTKTHQTCNKDYPYTKLLVPTEMMSLLRIPTCTILIMVMCELIMIPRALLCLASYSMLFCFHIV